MSLRTWLLQVVLMAVAITVIFGLAFGNRGLTLVVYVVMLSLLLPSANWLAQRSRRS